MKIFVPITMYLLVLFDIALILFSMKHIDESKIVVFIPIIVPIEWATVICVPWVKRFKAGIDKRIARKRLIKNPQLRKHHERIGG
ncbi:hypothetical protein [Chryseobacterium indoltheticum]|uniref:hypothetical protein n=1 Tax=Chryseobacterium indoltheticum TaxID=254 RepID=UPI003F491B13